MLQNALNCAYAERDLLDFCTAFAAGTLSGNPLAMVAGIKTLEILDRPGAYEHLDKMTNKLINGILDAAREAGHAICGGHISGTLSLPQYISRTAFHWNS